MPLGARRTAAAFFRNEPPQPSELEAAIDDVEDQVMRVADQLPEGSSLRAKGSFVAAVLILREFMHHVGFASVVFRPDSE